MPYFERTFGVLSPALRGFTVSLLMLMGALPGFFSGQLADRFGHLRVVMAGALVFMLGAILQGVSSQLPTFLVGRALCGIGEGLWIANISVYAGLFLSFFFPLALMFGTDRSQLHQIHLRDRTQRAAGNAGLDAAVHGGGGHLLRLLHLLRLRPH